MPICTRSYRECCNGGCGTLIYLQFFPPSYTIQCSVNVIEFCSKVYMLNGLGIETGGYDVTAYITFLTAHALVLIYMYTGIDIDALVDTTNFITNKLTKPPQSR